MFLTGGYSKDGFTPTTPNLILLEDELSVYDPKLYSKGINLIKSKYQREIPEAKTTNYLNAIRMLKEMKKKDALDILYYNDKFITETARSNFFIIGHDDVIHTSKDKVLKGITRQKVIQLAKNHYKVKEENIRMEDLNKKKLSLKVHPYLAAYLTKGLKSYRNKWFFKYFRWVKVDANNSYSYLEYHFFDENLEEIIL